MTETPWDICQVHEHWPKPHPELAFAAERQRILPAQYQCDDLRRLERSLLVQDDFLPAAELDGFHHALQQLLQSYGRNWSLRLQRDPGGREFSLSPRRKHSARLGRAETALIEGRMQYVVNHLWAGFGELLITRPEAISHIHSWINTGALADSQRGRYHFTHYDCDEYLEFSKGLYRFPAYAAVFYASIPEHCEGGATWFPEIQQGVIPKTNRLAIFDARLAHAVLPMVAARREARCVMVMNLWDYETRDEQYELSHGILGYTRNRRDELQWRP